MPEIMAQINEQICWNISDDTKLMFCLLKDKNTTQIRKGDFKNTPLKNTTTTPLSITVHKESTTVSKTFGRYAFSCLSLLCYGGRSGWFICQVHVNFHSALEPGKQIIWAWQRWVDSWTRLSQWSFPTLMFCYFLHSHPHGGRFTVWLHSQNTNVDCWKATSSQLYYSCVHPKENKYMKLATWETQNHLGWKRPSRS